jgi:YidC/Oxa1 family membrane protein insertase
MMKNMPASALDNPFAKQQKMLLYLMPLFFAISGVNFPIGVLLYWLTTNVWSMCQQFYVIRRMPAPGSPAEKAMQQRRARRGKPVEEFTVKGLDKGDKSDTSEAPRPSGQRQQPTRNKKKKGGAAKPRPTAPGSATSGVAATETTSKTDN